jgi:hypothetical protein
MNPEITKIIEQYLANELNATDRANFEARLKDNLQLQQELEKHQLIHEGAARATMRSQIQNVGKTYHLKKTVKITAIATGIILIAALASYLIVNAIKNSRSESESNQEIHTELDDKAPLSRVPIEYFEWENEAEVVLSKSGVLLSIPENAFLLNGEIYKGKATVQYQEAIDAATIMKSGLSTASDGRLLETQGMFGIQAFSEDGKELSINPKVGLYVQVPVDEHKAGMQLFSGEKEADGNINWVNPVPLEKIPVPVDMEKLDFYPEGYEAHLNQKKRSPKKQYRDSLYLSLEDVECVKELDIQVKAIQSEGNWEAKMAKIEKLIGLKINIVIDKSNQVSIVTDITIPKGEHFIVYDSKDLKEGAKNHVDYDMYGKFGYLQKNRNDSLNFKFVDQPKYKGEYMKVYNPVDGGMAKGYINNLRIIQPIEILSEEPFGLTVTLNNFLRNEERTVFPHIFYGTTYYTPQSNNYIPPSKVLAFWKPNFNNTLLATREFEKRMQAIHKSCNDKVLAVYTNGLDKSLRELDEQVVAMGFTNFNAFASENVGALNPNSPHLKGLKAFYEKGIAQLKASNLKNKKAKQAKEKKWDESVSQARAKEQVRTVKRDVKNLEEEYNFNLKNVAKQLGKTVGFQIHGGGTVYNIDKYVRDATVSRTSSVITDPETGKTAKITYLPFSFQVKDAKDFPTLNVYLFPSKLNSYQCIKGKDGNYDCPLNGDMVYDLAIVGMSDAGYFYYQKKFIKTGALGEIQLEKVSEKELDASIHSLNESRGIFKPMSIKQEIAWLHKEQQNYKVIKKRKEEAEFIKELKAIVFLCSSGDSIQSPIIQKLVK